MEKAGCWDGGVQRVTAWLVSDGGYCGGGGEDRLLGCAGLDFANLRCLRAVPEEEAVGGERGAGVGLCTTTHAETGLPSARVAAFWRRPKPTHTARPLRKGFNCYFFWFVCATTALPPLECRCGGRGRARRPRSTGCESMGEPVWKISFLVDLANRWSPPENVSSLGEPLDLLRKLPRPGMLLPSASIISISRNLERLLLGSCWMKNGSKTNLKSGVSVHRDLSRNFVVDSPGTCSEDPLKHPFLETPRITLRRPLNTLRGNSLSDCHR